MPVAPGECDIAVVGGGILGLAVARELAVRHPDAALAVLEREPEVGTGQTGRNSGVVHAGIYYAPGSLKARLCVEGARLLYEYCDEHGVPYERCGKLIVARDAGELGRLDELERRGRENGVPGLKRLDGDGLREIEPHVRGVAALHSPETGIVDFAAVARSLAAELASAGAPVVTGCEVGLVDQSGGRIVLRHSQGETRARFAVFCAGLAADRLAVAAGGSPDPRIVPFRGAYLYLVPERAPLVRGLIYPVPDPALPFLGVHLTRHVDGRVSLGPSALLWPRGPRDLLWPGTGRMARRWWRTGVRELRHAVIEARVRRGGRRLRAGAPSGRLPGRLRGRARAGARARRLARGRLRDLGDRARAARAQRAVAGGDLLARAGAAHRRPCR